MPQERGYYANLYQRSRSPSSLKIHSTRLATAFREQGFSKAFSFHFSSRNLHWDYLLCSNSNKEPWYLKSIESTKKICEKSFARGENTASPYGYDFALRTSSIMLQGWLARAFAAHKNSQDNASIYLGNFFSFFFLLILLFFFFLIST